MVARRNFVTAQLGFVGLGTAKSRDLAVPKVGSNFGHLWMLIGPSLFSSEMLRAGTVYHPEKKSTISPRILHQSHQIAIHGGVRNMLSYIIPSSKMAFYTLWKPW